MEIFLALFIIAMMAILISVLWWDNQTLRKKYNQAIKEYTEEVAKWRQ